MMDQLVQYLAWLDDQHETMLDLVQQLCNQNSGTMNLPGLAIVQEMLAREFDSLSGEAQFVDIDCLKTIDVHGNEVEQPLGQAIHILKRPQTRPRIMLCIHMDTVYGIDHSFQTCVSRDGGKLNGPGVADAKGGLVVMLFALRALERSPLADRIGWEVLINPDEELGSPGSASFIRSRAPHCDFGLLFEPSLPDGTLVSWRKGVGNFAFVVRGRSAHSGREFDKGRNAIVALSQLIDEVDRLNTDPEVTFNVGRVSGGGALNVVPDLAIGRVNARVKTLEQADWVEKQLSRIADQFSQLDGMTVEVSGRFTSPPKMLCDGARELQSRIESCGEALGLNIRWRGTGGASDGNKFADAGLPNIDSLGPRGGDIHSVNEYLIVESLVERAKLTALILMSFAAEQDQDV